MGANISYILQSSNNWFKSNMAILLFLATLVLFVSKSLYNIPIGIMALIGLFRFAYSPKQTWQNPEIRLITILFFCLWLPLLISLIDAVNYGRSMQTVFPYLRFLFFGVFIIQEINKPKVLEKLKLAIFCIIAFWCIDAVIQYLFKINLFGHPYDPLRITGIFYPEITIGHITAALSPLYFDIIWTQRKQHKWLWILLIPLFIVILLSGKRAAWIMLAVSSLGYTLYFFKLNLMNKFLAKRLCLIGICIIMVIGSVIATNEYLQRRIQVTSGLFKGNYEIAEIATGYRFSLWQTSINIFQENWINGIGPRGYRYVYQQYSDSDDRFHVSGQTHPHQLIFEILAETGLIGLIGFLLFSFLLYRFIKSKHLGIKLFPWWLAVLVAVFPINTHMAFYGSYWSSIFWWLIVLMFAVATTHLSVINETQTNKYAS